MANPFEAGINGQELMVRINGQTGLALWELDRSRGPERGDHTYCDQRTPSAVNRHRVTAFRHRISLQRFHQCSLGVAALVLESEFDQKLLRALETSRPL